jgi:DNA-binding NarL/FixJ family response regulator
MDLTIPGGMGGKEAVEKLLAIDSEARIIVWSGYSTDPIMPNYVEFGIKGRIVKPFQMRDLEKEISQVLALG